MLQRKLFEYDKPVLHGYQEIQQTCSIDQAWAKVVPTLSSKEKQHYIDQIKLLLCEKKAVLVAHYYVGADLQNLAMETGGCVGDSLEMARFGKEHSAQTLIVAGVRFMGETAKILSPDKTVLMPDLEANCSLDLGCPIDEFNAFCDQYPDRTVVVYANTSAEVKARADWVVTSSIGLEIVTALHQRGEKILWAPDRHLGSYIQQQTGADMVLWQGSCLVHNEFKGLELSALKQKHPRAKVLVHPESPASVVAQADVVGSTSKLINAVVNSDDQAFIVATDQGILHEMRRLAPQKHYYAAPTAGHSAGCKSCAFCPWMAMNSLQGVVDCLVHNKGEVDIDADLGVRASRSIDRMLNFAAEHKRRIRASGEFEQDQALFQTVGAA